MKKIHALMRFLSVIVLLSITGDPVYAAIGPTSRRAATVAGTMIPRVSQSISSTARQVVPRSVSRAVSKPITKPSTLTPSSTSIGSSLGFGQRFADTMHSPISSTYMRTFSTQMPTRGLFEGANELLLEADTPFAVERALEAGADLEAGDDSGWTVLTKSAILHRPELLKYLISAGANINARDKYQETPLHIAAGGENTDTVKLLIDAHANVNARDQFERTPLHIAAVNGNADVIKLLIRARADVNAPDNDGRTALYYAASSNCAECIEALMRVGAFYFKSYDAKWGSGTTPLQALVARTKNRLTDSGKAMDLLLEQTGCYIDEQDREGNTPLHYALRQGSKEDALLLLARGADLNKPNYSGLTPLTFARMRYLAWVPALEEAYEDYKRMDID